MLVLIFTLALMAFAAEAAAQSDAALAPDGKFVMVQKNLGTQRWAIVREQQSKTVTGNVFNSDGSAQFVWCQHRGGTSYECIGNDGCTQSPCQWRPISTVQIPESFFSLRGDPVPTPGPGPTPRPTNQPSSGLSGLIGTWDTTFRIVSSYTYRYRFQEVRQSTVGNYQILVGRDEQNDVVLLARTRDLIPDEPAPYEYFALEDDSIVCEAYFFDQTGPDRLSGIHSSVPVVGGECGSAIGEHDATAIRFSRSATEEAGSAKSLGRAVKQQKRSGHSQAREEATAAQLPDGETLRLMMDELRRAKESKE